MTEFSGPAEMETAAMRAYHNGRFDEAIQLFASAEVSLRSAGDKKKAAEMANNRSVALLQVHRPREALEAVEATPAVFEKHGDRLLTGQAYGNIAAAHEELGHLEQARDAYRTCADVLGSLGASEQQAVALQGLSRVQLRLGQPLPAVAAMEAGLDAHPSKGIRQRFLRRLLQIPRRLMGR